MKCLRISVIILGIITLSLGGYIIYKEFINKEDVNLTEYETKISNLEEENKRLKEENSSLNNNKEKDAKYIGTYTYGKYYEDCTNIEMTDENHYHFEVIINEDGTYEYTGGVNCGNSGSSEGYYYYNDKEIILVNKELLENPDSAGASGLKAVLEFKKNGDNLEFNFLDKTFELIKE